MKSKRSSSRKLHLLTFGAMAAATAVAVAAVAGPGIYHAAVEHPWMVAGHVAAIVLGMIVAALWEMEHGLLIGMGCIILLQSSDIAERIAAMVAP